MKRILIIAAIVIIVVVTALTIWCVAILPHTT